MNSNLYLALSIFFIILITINLISLIINLLLKLLKINRAAKDILFTTIISILISGLSVFIGIIQPLNFALKYNIQPTVSSVLPELYFLFTKKFTLIYFIISIITIGLNLTLTFKFKSQKKQ